MPMIQPDTSAATEMQAIAPGTYAGKILKVDYGMSAKGNPMLTITYELQVDGKARVRKGYHVITGEGAYGFDNLLRSTGFDAIADQYKAKDGEKPSFDTDDLIGKELQIVIDSQLYNNELRDQIKSFLKA